MGGGGGGGGGGREEGHLVNAVSSSHTTQKGENLLPR